MTELFKKYVFIYHLFWSILLQKATEIDNFFLQDEDNANSESLFLITEACCFKEIVEIYTKKNVSLSEINETWLEHNSKSFKPNHSALCCFIAHP